MAMYQIYQLPFELVRPCRCSYVVSFTNDNGDRQEAFISNENLFRLMMNPDTPIKLIPKKNQNGTEQIWIMVCKMEWTLGFKKPIFGPDGYRF